MQMTTSTGSIYLQDALQFLQDLPFAQIGAAAASGGTNVMVDIGALEGIVAAGLKDFLSGTSPTAAPATAAAVTAAANAGTPAKE
jgi:hypothetical protein